MTERQMHEQSDGVLNETTKLLNKQYNAAYKEAKDYLAIELAKVELSGMAQQRYNELLKYDRLDKMCSEVANIILNANKTTKKEVNNLAVAVYKMNYDWQADKLGLDGVNKTESKEAYEEVDMFDVIALAALTDKDVIERDVKSKIVQAVMSKAGDHSDHANGKQRACRCCGSCEKARTEIPQSMESGWRQSHKAGTQTCERTSTRL